MDNMYVIDIVVDYMGIPNVTMIPASEIYRKAYAANPWCLPTAPKKGS